MKLRLFYLILVSVQFGVLSAQQFSESEDYKRTKTAERLYNEGIKSVIEKDYYSALFYFDSVISVKPDFVKVYNERGKIFFTKDFLILTGSLKVLPETKLKISMKTIQVLLE